MLAMSRSSPRIWATSRPDARRSRLNSVLFLTVLSVLLWCASCSLFASERPPAKVRPPRPATVRPIFIVATWWADLDGTTHNAYVIWPAEAFEENELDVARELEQHRRAPFYERGDGSRGRAP
jgi:hypothetical protein